MFSNPSLLGEEEKPWIILLWLYFYQIRSFHPNYGILTVVMCWETRRRADKTMNRHWSTMSISLQLASLFHPPQVKMKNTIIFKMSEWVYRSLAFLRLNFCAVPNSTPHHNFKNINTTQQYTTQHHATPCHATRPAPHKRSTARHGTAQHSIAQHKTAQRNQHSTAHRTAQRSNSISTQPNPNYHSKNSKMSLRSAMDDLYAIYYALQIVSSKQALIRIGAQTMLAAQFKDQRTGKTVLAMQTRV